MAEGAQLIEDLYQAFYQELQKPLLPDQARAVGNSPGPANVVAEKAASSAATAKVMQQMLNMQMLYMQRSVLSAADLKCNVARWSIHDISFVSTITVYHVLCDDALRPVSPMSSHKLNMVCKSLAVSYYLLLLLSSPGHLERARDYAPGQPANLIASVKS